MADRREMFRGMVTMLVVVVVGLYVIDKLTRLDGEAPAGEEYVNVRGVIAAATAIAKGSPIMGKLSRHEQEG